MDNLIGKKLDGRYLIESLIGVGGMANVYRGKDTQTGNAVAVKVLKEELMDNEELVRRFKNESKAISILSHPNIVKVYDVFCVGQDAVHRHGIYRRHYAERVPQAARRRPDLERDGALCHPDPGGAGACPRQGQSSTGTSNPRTSCCWPTVPSR